MKMIRAWSRSASYCEKSLLGLKTLNYLSRLDLGPSIRLLIFSGLLLPPTGSNLFTLLDINYIFHFTAKEKAAV